jgi:protocatechuate 3,4-dioxygenase beta subunit
MKRFLKFALLVMLVSCSSEPAADKTDVKSATGATIEGVVREEGTDTPISGVRVFVVRPSNQPQVQATTDGDGKFSLQGLDAGRHSVALLRDGYVVRGRLESSGYPFRLTANQKVSGVVFHLLPAGTLAGRVLNANGMPAQRVEVQLLQNLYVMGHQQWSRVNRGGIARETQIETNERGEFRAIGIDPGMYAVRLVPHEASVESLVPGSKGPKPLVYSGVEIKPARETMLNDLKLVNESRGWIRIALVNESGESLEGFGNWQVEPAGWMGSDYPLVEQRVVDAFREIQPDMPGVFEITASWSTTKGPLAAKMQVNYQGADITTKLTLPRPQASLTGSVMLEGKPLSGVEVSIGPDIPYFIRSNPEGMLSTPAVYAGSYKLGAIRNLPPDTFVSRVSQGGRDVLKQDFIVDKGEVKLDVVVSSGAGVVQGTVTGSSGKPIQNALVALVPEGDLRQRSDYYGAYQSMRTDQNGEFEIHGITPGAYRAYAWSDAPATAFRSDAFLKPYAAKATAVNVTMGGREKLELKTLDSTP